MKTKAKLNNRNQPYMQEYYNCRGIFQTSFANSGMLSRVHNALIAEMNKKENDQLVQLPKYLVIMLDVDLINSIKFYDFGAQNILTKCTKWLKRNINTSLATRKEDLKVKRPEALMNAETPIIIWISALPRPPNSKRKEIFALVKKFNDIFNSICDEQSNAIQITLATVNEANYFDCEGRLTAVGKEQFWKELDTQIREIDCTHFTQFQFKKTPPCDDNTDGRNRRESNTTSLTSHRNYRLDTRYQPQDRDHHRYGYSHGSHDFYNRLPNWTNRNHTRHPANQRSNYHRGRSHRF